MLMQVGVFIVCLALALLLTAKSAKEVFGVMQDQSAKKAANKTPTDEEKRKAQRSRREIENFMTYNGKAQEGYHGD